jgi:AcrR family transcriptional regulator
MTEQRAPARIDGRRARGERTRLNVLEALLRLVEAGHLRPTAQEVADGAGVALRTVYHHFDDVEALRRLAFDLQVSRHRDMLRSVDTSQTMAERCREVSHQLRRFHEAISPIRRAIMAEEPSSPAMADSLRQVRMMRRDFVEAAFAPETSRLDLASRRAVLDALDVTTSWQTWYYLRGSLGRGAQVAERVLDLQLEQLLGAVPGTEARPESLTARAAAGGRAGAGSPAGRSGGSSIAEAGLEPMLAGEQLATTEDGGLATRTAVSGRDRRRRSSARSGPGR